LRLDETEFHVLKPWVVFIFAMKETEFCGRNYENLLVNIDEICYHFIWVLLPFKGDLKD